MGAQKACSSWDFEKYSAVVRIIMEESSANSIQVPEQFVAIFTKEVAMSVIKPMFGLFWSHISEL